jgi:hypothetical protein
LRRGKCLAAIGSSLNARKRQNGSSGWFNNPTLVIQRILYRARWSRRLFRNANIGDVCLMPSRIRRAWIDREPKSIPSLDLILVSKTGLWLHKILESKLSSRKHVPIPPNQKVHAMFAKFGLFKDQFTAIRARGLSRVSNCGFIRWIKWVRVFSIIWGTCIFERERKIVVAVRGPRSHSGAWVDKVKWLDIIRWAWEAKDTASCLWSEPTRREIVHDSFVRAMPNF